MSCPTTTPPAPTQFTLKKLIEHYNEHYKDVCVEIFKLKNTLDYVCGAPNPNYPKQKLIKDFHQRYLTETQVENAVKTLRDLSPKDYATFDEWVDSIWKIKMADPDSLKRLGWLCVYDFALRSGINIAGLEPDKNVYLHAGAYTGAKELEDLGYVKLPHPRKWRVDIKLFPKELQALGAKHLENFLCVEKDNIAKLPKKQ